MEDPRRSAGEAESGCGLSPDYGAITVIQKGLWRGWSKGECFFSGHSLRAGFVTSSLDHKVDLFKIMGITGHVKVDTLRCYDRRENDFDDAADRDFL